MATFGESIVPTSSADGDDADGTATETVTSTGTGETTGGGVLDVPPWASALILLGAMFILIIIFTTLCWVARSVILTEPASSSSTSDTDSDPTRGPRESRTRGPLMRLLDEFAPAKTYEQLKVDKQTEAANPAAPHTNTLLVCVICLETLQDKDLVRDLPCGHIYHSECIEKWHLKQHHTCPVCKTFYVPAQFRLVGRPYPHRADMTYHAIVV